MKDTPEVLEALTMAHEVRVSLEDCPGRCFVCGFLKSFVVISDALNQCLEENNRLNKEIKKLRRENEKWMTILGPF